MAAIRFQEVCKQFPGVRALDDVSFEVAPGSVHALCGENGAGKSTLLKILSGAYRADSGTIFLGEDPVHFNAPHEALQAGVAVIYQELHLAPDLSVAENIFLGHLPNDMGIVRRGELFAKTRAQLKHIGVDIDPSVKVGTLPLAQRQMVEIGKALSRDAKIIAFDEPTSALSSREVERLFEIIAELKRQGRAILYVSHRMDEIFRVCDAATVLRDGKHVETFASLEGLGPADIVRRMVGRELTDIWGYRPRPHGEQILQVEGLTGPGLSEPAHLALRSGEIVGVFGLVGAGRTELLQAIYKATNSHGEIALDGALAGYRDPRGAIRKGICLCPEDRKKEGIVGLRSVKENINLSARRNTAVFGFVVNESWETANARKQVNALGIKTPTLDQPIQLLSGGNQQKTILARWLSEDLKVLMLDEPTRGIDVGAKREIYEILYGLAESGIGVLFVSSELPEVIGVADRILVMKEGCLVGEVAKGDATEELILAMALPGSSE